MDIFTIILGLAITFICLSPFLLVYLQRNKRIAKGKNSLSEIAGRNNGTIDKWLLSETLLFGIDERNSMLYFLHEMGETEETQIIDISNLEKCILQTFRNQNENTDLSKVQIEFIFYQKESTLVEIYNCDKDGLTIGNQLMDAQRWMKEFEKYYR